MPVKATSPITALQALATQRAQVQNDKRKTALSLLRRVSLGYGVSLSATRKLLQTAFRTKHLSIHIGIPPGSPRGEDEPDHSPCFYYEGTDITKLSELGEKTAEASATLVYGDGGMEICSDDDVEEALRILEDNYREPDLILYFWKPYMETGLRVSCM